MKWLGRALLASLALLFLMAAAAAWIVNTQAGSSWALRRAAALSPQPLTFGAIEGTIAGALVLHELRYGGDDSRLMLSAQRVRLQLALGDLLGGAIHVEAAQVADLFVSMRDMGDRERERPDAPPDLRPPLDLVVDLVQLRRGVVRNGDELLLDIRNLRLGGRWTHAGIFVDSLDARWSAAHLPEPLGGQQLATSGKGARIRLDANGAPQLIRIEQLVVDQRSGRLVVQGAVELEPMLAWRVTIEATDFNPGAVLARWPGNLRFSLASSGRMEAGLPRGELHITNLRGRLRGRPVSGAADLSLGSQGVPSGNLRVRSGDSRIALDARRGERWDVRGTVAIASLDDWIAQSSGRVRGDFSLEGAWPKLDLSASARATDVEVGAVNVGSATLEAAIDNIRSPSGSARLALKDLVLASYTIASAEAEATGSADAHTIAVDIEGKPFSVSLRASGSRESDRNERWRETLQRLTIDAPVAGRLSLQQSTTLLVTRAGLKLSDACLANAATEICVSGRTTDTGAFSARYRLANLPLASLAAFIPEQAPLSITGSLHGEGQLQRDATGRIFGDATLRSARGELLRTLEGAVAAQQLLTYRDFQAKLRLDGSEAQAFVSANLNDDGSLQGAVQISGLGTATRPIEGEITLRLQDLAPLSALSLQLADLQGSVELVASLDGTLASPQIAPRLTATRLSLEAPALGIELREGTLRASPAGKERVAVSGSIKSGDGELSVEGTISYDGRMQLEIDGERFLAADLPGVRVVASPHLQLEREQQRLVLSGRVLLPSAAIDVQKLPRAARAQTGSPDIVIVGSRSQDESRRDELSRLPLYANVTVQLGENVTLSGFGLQSTVTGQVSVHEAPGQPTTGSGELRVSGEYKAYGQDLTITEGSLLYANTPLSNPSLRIVAVREIDDDVTAGLRIAGTARSPQLTVFSDPQMGDANALSYLVAGRPLDAIGQEDGDALQSAARSLGSAAGGLLSKRIGKRLGLDTVGVKESEALGGAAFTVGEYLSPRLYLSYGVGLFEPGDVVTLRYRLTDDLVLRALRGPNDTRAGIEYRVEK